jgi:hypothetical protein
MPQPARTALEKALVGPAGEHYVLFRLFQRGLMASLAPPGAPNVDILVLATDESAIASVQVKTRNYGADGGWHMNVKHETIFHDRFFYIFVDLEPEVPGTFVVPSEVVAKVLTNSYRAWLNAPGKGGKSHREHNLRRMVPSWGFEVEGFSNGWLDEYREKWELLSAPVGDNPN